MMDEGAASLRDRDMIARRRGGPFVHRSSTFSLSTSRTRVHSSASSLLLAALAYVAHRACTPVTGPSDLACRCLAYLRVVESTNLRRNVSRTNPPPATPRSRKIGGCDLSCSRGIFKRYPQAMRSEIESLEIESAIRRFRCHRSSRDQSSILRLDRPKRSWPDCVRLYDRF